MTREEIEDCILTILTRFKCGDLNYEDSLKLIMSYVRKEEMESPILPPFSCVTIKK